jgi:transposase InsO family protein
VGQYRKRQLCFDAQMLELIAEAEALRRQHPGCGVEKMYEVLKPCFVGRDRFVEIMMEAGFRLKRPRNVRRTTYPGKTYYPNLIKGLEVSAPSTVWQSDITYLSLGMRFYYAVFIIDVYSKKIVGYEVSRDMRASANVRALARALKGHAAPRIHHSDRGSQYTAAQYLALLKSCGSSISMGLKAQDNAYAERVNRTIKEEYLDGWKAASFEQLKAQVVKAVKHYNCQRPHNHLGKLSPIAFEKQWHILSRSKRQVMTIFDDNNF